MTPTTFWILPKHAAQCLGIVDVGHLDLPAGAYGFDADALLHCPRYAEVVRELAAIQHQRKTRRHDWERNTKASQLIAAPPKRPKRKRVRSPEERERNLQQRRERRRQLKAMKI